MSNKEYFRKRKEDRPVLAICYDFDKTLSPDNMQAQGYIQSVGYEATDDFWKIANSLAEDNEMDQNLSCMLKMKDEAEGRLVFTRSKLEEYGSRVKLFPGVETWFERMRRYGAERGVIVEHYIISSGLKEMIEGTSVAKAGAFERIYASFFYYNERGVAVWPAQVVNSTNKTQFLFRIEKGVLDINDTGVNDHFPPEDIRVPFRNMVYIGDSDTDIPCMMLVNGSGGHSIGIYDHITQDKAKVYKMMRENRIKYFVPSDYSEGTELDMLLKAIIDKTAAAEKLERIYESKRRENIEADRQNPEEEQKKIDLMLDLKESANFSRTRDVVSKLNMVDDWSKEQTEQLFDIASENSQVRYLLHDEEVKSFYKKLSEKHKLKSEAYAKIKSLLK